MISTGFWIVYLTLVVLIAGLAALTLYVAQSALRKSFAYQEETLKRLMDVQARELRAEVGQEVAKHLDDRLAVLEARLAELMLRMERAFPKAGTPPKP